MLEKFFHKIKEKSIKNGKPTLMYTAAEAFESFFNVPDKVTLKGAHIRDNMDLKRTMSMVIIALMPALLFGIYNVGYQHFNSIGELGKVAFIDIVIYGLIKVIPIVAVSYIVGLGIEFMFAHSRGHEVNEGFLVSGMLIPLVCPPDIPLWMVAVATAFAVIIGKEVFGGTGMNVWNPALIARAFLYFAYPAQISGDKVWIAGMPDAYSGATPLSELTTNNIHTSLSDLFFGLIPGCIGETSKLAILIGAAFLIITGVGSLRIMFWTVVGALGMGFLFNLVGTEYNVYTHVSPLEHILLGGFLFGAVFMATDPVTAAQTNKGKIIYGLLIGIVAVLIRVANPAYPEGIMLAILLMNTFAPLIDHIVISFNIKKRKNRVKLTAK